MDEGKAPVEVTAGRIVNYTISEVDAKMAAALPAGMNAPRAGQVCPAMVVRASGGTTVNLRVFLDGGAGADLWATSRILDETGKPGTWAWPTRA